MKNKYNFCILKVYWLISEHCQLKNGLGGCCFWVFFQKRLSLKRQICTHGAAESLAEQWGGPCPRSAWYPERRQLCHYQGIAWETCVLAAAEFSFSGGKPQPCSTPALHAHFFPFPSSLGCTDAFSQHPFPSCCPWDVLPWDALLSGSCAAQPSRALPSCCPCPWHSDQLSPLHSCPAAGEVSAPCEPVELQSGCSTVFCFIMAPFHTPMQLTYPTVFHFSWLDSARYSWALQSRSSTEPGLLSVLNQP